jgi:hypothetical protein
LAVRLGTSRAISTFSPNAPLLSTLERITE